MNYKPLYVLTPEQEAAFAVGADALVDRFGNRRPEGALEGVASNGRHDAAARAES
jgi:hypothetical protein